MSEMDGPEPTAEHEQGGSPIYLATTWSERGPYTGDFYKATEYLEAASADEAIERSTLVPGFGNELQVSEAYASYQDKINDDVDAMKARLDNVFEALKGDPTRQEHVIFGQLCQMLTQTEATQAWVERFGKVTPVPDTKPAEPVAGDRWAAVIDHLETARPLIDGMRVGPREQQAQLIELRHEVDAALTAISGGGEKEFRPCKDCTGPRPQRAVWRMELTDTHERSRDNDIFCVSHAQSEVDQADQRRESFEVVKIIPADEHGLPQWSEPITRAHRDEASDTGRLF